MNPIKALKRWLALRMSRSEFVRNKVGEQLSDHPAFLGKLGKDPQAFEAILSGVASSEQAMTRIIDHPDVIARIMRSPKVFEKFMTAVAVNPEIVFRVLKKREIRKNLAAQKSFLISIVQQKRILNQLVEAIPEQGRGDVIAQLTSPETEYLRAMADTPQMLATALLARKSFAAQEDTPAEPDNSAVLDGLIEILQENAPSTLLALVEHDPDILSSGPLRDKALKLFVSDTDALIELFVLYAMNIRNGTTPSVRYAKLLERLFQEPSFIQSLIKDKQLRQNILFVLEDTTEAAGSTVSDLLAEARSGEQQIA